MNVLQEYRRCHGDGRDVHHHRPGVRGRHHRGLSQEEQTPERGESLTCQVINCHSSDHLLNHSTSVTLHTLHRNKYNCVTRLIKRGWIFNWLIWIDITNSCTGRTTGKCANDFFIWFTIITSFIISKWRLSDWYRDHGSGHAHFLQTISSVQNCRVRVPDVRYLPL